MVIKYLSYYCCIVLVVLGLQVLPADSFAKVAISSAGVTHSQGHEFAHPEEAQRDAMGEGSAFLMATKAASLAIVRHQETKPKMDCGTGCKKCWRSGKNKGTCRRCEAGAYLSADNICTSCGDDCHKCWLSGKNKGTCKRCKAGKYLSADNICTSCGDDCRKCWLSGKKMGTCKICKNRKYLSGGACIPECPDGLFPWGMSRSGMFAQCKVDVCTPSQCFGCSKCSEKAYTSDSCAKVREARGCVNPAVIRGSENHPGAWKCANKMETCNLDSDKCFIVLQCKDPCICDSWKSGCVGMTQSVPYDSDACAKLKERRTSQKGEGTTDNVSLVLRTGRSVSTSGRDDVDGALKGKCVI